MNIKDQEKKKEKKKPRKVKLEFVWFFIDVNIDDIIRCLTGFESTEPYLFGAPWWGTPFPVKKMPSRNSHIECIKCRWWPDAVAAWTNWEVISENYPHNHIPYPLNPIHCLTFWCCQICEVLFNIYHMEYWANIIWRIFIIPESFIANLSISACSSDQ